MGNSLVSSVGLTEVMVDEREEVHHAGKRRFVGPSVAAKH